MSGEPLTHEQTLAAIMLRDAWLRMQSTFARCTSGLRAGQPESYLERERDADVQEHRRREEAWREACGGTRT